MKEETMEGTGLEYAVRAQDVDRTGSSRLVLNGPGSTGVAAVLTFAFLAGTGGITSPSYYAKRQQPGTGGYGFVQVQPTAGPSFGQLRTPQEDIARIRSIFRPSIADLAGTFNVSRQTIYNWMSGETPSEENIERLEDLGKAADLLFAYGSRSSYLVRRKLSNGKTLMESVRDGGSAEDAARSLLRVAEKEMMQRETLRLRLGNRTAPRDLSDVGVPMLNEDIG
jgi:transcriptional regulator with XRE-family HTH domain